VQEGCFSCQQRVAISGRASTGRQYVERAGSWKCYNFLQILFFYFILLALLVFFNLRLSSAFFVDVPLCTRRRIKRNRNLLFLPSPPDSGSSNNNGRHSRDGRWRQYRGSRGGGRTGLVAVQNCSSHCQKVPSVTVAAMSFCLQQTTHSKWKIKRKSYRKTSA
jgi:hypothetical protein